MTDLPALAARYGTPLYVFDLDDVRAARAQLFQALPAGFEVYYAFKANPHPDIGRTLREGERPCRAEISSTGELAAAVGAGFDPGEILYTGPGKTDHELAAALHAGVRMFSVESESDLRHVGVQAEKQGVTAQALLRVNSQTASASTSIRMMGKPSQFGIDSETLPEAMPRLLTTPGARVVGAHIFSQSNARDEESLVAEFQHAVELAARLNTEVRLPLEFLDIGGGFSSPYAAPGPRAQYPNLAASLERLLDRHIPTWRTGTHLAVESGRYLAGGSGSLVCQVVNVKDSRGSRFVVLDAGINAVGGLSGIGRLLPASVGLAEPGPITGALVGPLCTPGDTLGKAVAMPELSDGDLVTVPNVGAYGVTASLFGFLGREAPAEVAVRGGEVVSATRLDYRRVELA
jgi:diaminopimelate decarboxylase